MGLGISPADGEDSLYCWPEVFKKSSAVGGVGTRK